MERATREPNFLGEYELKVDAKKRIMLPAGLKKQLEESQVEIQTFVINRSFDRCLNLHPLSRWQEIDTELAKLNPFVKKERDFVRFVRGGATEVNLDGQGRLNLPARLMSYANISSQIILLGNGPLIEMWDLATYEMMLDIDPEEISALAEEVMVKIDEPIVEEPFDESIVVPIIRR